MFTQWLTIRRLGVDVDYAEHVCVVFDCADRDCHRRSFENIRLPTYRTCQANFKICFTFFCENKNFGFAKPCLPVFLVDKGPGRVSGGTENSVATVPQKRYELGEIRYLYFLKLQGLKSKLQ